MYINVDLHLYKLLKNNSSQVESSMKFANADMHNKKGKCKEKIKNSNIYLKDKDGLKMNYHAKMRNINIRLTSLDVDAWSLPHIYLRRDFRSQIPHPLH